MTEPPKSMPPPGFFPGEEEPADTPSEMGLWAGVGREPARRRDSGAHFQAAPMRRVKDDVAERCASGEWEGATPRHLVALYEVLHQDVYGVEASDMTPRERQQAALAAGRVVKDEFDGDVAAAVELIRWAWKREEGREKWRRENGRSGSRLGWRLLFGAMLVDWRLERERAKHAGRPR